MAWTYRKVILRVVGLKKVSLNKDILCSCLISNEMLLIWIYYKSRLVSCIIEIHLQDQTLGSNFPSFLNFSKEIKNDRDRSVIENVIFKYIPCIVIILKFFLFTN